MNASAKKVLTSALGLPCWQVRWDSQVGLDMDFGVPSVEVRERRVRKDGSSSGRKLSPRRWVMLSGTHWLIAYPRRWRLEFADGLVVRDTSSMRKLDLSVARLKGEALDGLTVDPRTGATVFYFDLGARLIVRGARRSGSADEDELWSIHSYKRYVSLYAGGQYATGSTISNNDAEMMPIDEPGLLVIARTARVRQKLLAAL